MNIPLIPLEEQLENSIIDALMEWLRNPTYLHDPIEKHTGDVIGRLDTLKLTPERLNVLYKAYWEEDENTNISLYRKKTSAQAAAIIASRIVVDLDDMPPSS